MFFLNNLTFLTFRELHNDSNQWFFPLVRSLVRLKQFTLSSTFKAYHVWNILSKQAHHRHKQNKHTGILPVSSVLTLADDAECKMSRVLRQHLPLSYWWPPFTDLYLQADVGVNPAAFQMIASIEGRSLFSIVNLTALNETLIASVRFSFKPRLSEKLCSHLIHFILCPTFQRT